MPTPVRVRGKQGNKRLMRSSEATIAKLTSSTQSSKTRALSGLETLPIELVQSILWESLNLNLTVVSPILASKLNNNNLRRRFIFLSFFDYHFGRNHDGDSIDHYLGQNCDGNCRLFSENVYKKHLDWNSKLFLINDIVDQAWFSARLFFSCQQEYLSRLVPSPFSDLIEARFKVATKPWTLLQQNNPDRVPLWFTELSRTNNSDQQMCSVMEQTSQTPVVDDSIHWSSYDAGHVGITYCADSVDGVDRASRFWWHKKNQDGSGDHFVVGTACLRDRVRPSPNLRLFNPTMWTEDDLALLLILTENMEAYGNSAGLINAISLGLTKAISQKFVPAVFITITSYVNQRSTSLDDDLIEELVLHIVEHAHQQAAQGDDSTNTSWVIQYASNAAYAFEDKYCAKNHIEELPTFEHLVEAMQMACGADMDVASYYIFCWLSINFIIKTTNHPHLNPHYPEKELKEIHRLALTADTEYANKCWYFFSNAMEKAWNGETGLFAPHSSGEQLEFEHLM